MARGFDPIPWLLVGGGYFGARTGVFGADVQNQIGVFEGRVKRALNSGGGGGGAAPRTDVPISLPGGRGGSPPAGQPSPPSSNCYPRFTQGVNYVDENPPGSGMFNVVLQGQIVYSSRNLIDAQEQFNKRFCDLRL